MKIAITGHTSGIGAATMNLLKSQGHKVLGFSRHNGWDFTDKETRKEFIEELDDAKFDCFINNAYPHKFYQSMEGFFQVELLNKAWLLWEKKKDKKKAKQMEDSEEEEKKDNQAPKNEEEKVEA